MRRSILALVGMCALVACSSETPPTEHASASAEWRVVATSAGEAEIDAIKAVREVTDLGLKDAKDLVDNVPSVIVSGVSKEQAESAAQRLRAAGMTLRVDPMEP